jgi:DNA-directed RNA polymerase subunit N (RpoN/RPB10)
MATFIPGIRCAISGRAIGSANEAVAFPPFIANEADPLHVFSDAVVHADVFRTHALAADAQLRLEEARQRTAPNNRRCFICGQLITDPDNYLGLGYLVENRSSPLYRFNYAHFHRSCLATWQGLSGLVTELEALDGSGLWKGEALKRLITALRSESVLCRS